jgi:hypothetical protein
MWDSGMRFLCSGFIHLSTPFVTLFNLRHFFLILFRICRAIQIQNSYCSTGRCRYKGFKTVHTLISIIVPLKVLRYGNWFCAMAHSEQTNAAPRRGTQ